jgi:pimeloyl-ACP methyl ester carboxylesterase
MSAAEPFDIHVPDAVLADLAERLSRARLAPDFANEDWDYGVNGDYLAALVAYWRDGFDWRAQEKAMNAFSHYRAEIDGIPIHFLHQRGTGPNPVPLVLTHGWPSTFWDFHKVIGPLTDPAAHGGDPADDFDVVVPSLPGFGFSSPLTTPGVTLARVADLWATLMRDVLGYERFAAHGGDNGASVTVHLGHKYADRLLGIHMAPGPHRLETWKVERPWSDLTGSFLPQDPEQRAAMIEWEKRYVSHATVQVMDPQTLAYGLNDSPVGLAAWLLERRRTWSDCGGDVERVFTKDELLATIMIYWATQTVGTAARLYRDCWVGARAWAPAHDRVPSVEAPTGVTLYTSDLPPNLPTEWMSSYYNLAFLRSRDTGGHFVASEDPEGLVDDLRAFIRPLRVKAATRPSGREGRERHSGQA